MTSNIYKKEDTLEYGEQMLKMIGVIPVCADDKQAGEQLEHICRRSVNIARIVKPSVKKNNFS